MEKTDKTVRSVTILVIFQFLSKILGFFRETLIGNSFGATAATDVFFMAMRFINLFYAVIGATINTTLIPVLAEVKHKEGNEGKLSHVNIFLNSIGVIALLISVFALLFAPLLLKILAAGFDEQKFDFLVLLTRIGIPALILGTVQAVYRAFLQSSGSFKESALSQFPFNFVYIIFLLTAAQTYGVSGLMIINSLAILSTILIQIPELKRLDYRYKFLIDFKDKYMTKTFQLMPPILLSVAINDINQTVDMAMASALPAGSISALNYATKLNGFTVGIFVSAIVTVIYPLLAQTINEGSLDKFKQAIMKGINIVFMVIIPASIGLIVLAEPIVKLAFEHGVFNAEATYLTAGALRFYALGAFSASAQGILIRAFYSLQDTKIALHNSVLTLVLNIIFNLIFVQMMGHRGLALATALASIITFGILFIKLRRRIGKFGGRNLLYSTAKIVGASLLMGFVVWVLRLQFLTGKHMGFLIETSTLLFLVLVGIAVYFTSLTLLKVPELIEMWQYIKRRFAKS